MIDTSKVDRMDDRNRLDANDARREAIIKEMGEISKPYIARVEAIMQERAQAVAGLQAKLSALDEETAEDDKLAYDFEHDGRVSRCCVSGLVLLSGDETVADDDGREALRAVLPWPVREQDEADDDDEQEAA